MSLQNWSESKTRNAVVSEEPEAQFHQQELSDEPALRDFLAESIRSAVAPAAIGVCVGILGSCPRNRSNSISRAFAFGFLGGVIGFGAGVAWESRGLTASAVRRTTEKLGRMRDERWMKKHFIAYA